MSRKTVEVEQVREWVNTRLACPDSTQRLEDLTPDQAFRLGAASLFEQIAHTTGNYRGFRYSTEGVLIGDETRRYYFPSPI